MDISISFQEVIGVIACVAILLWLLNRYFFAPISKILDERKDIIQNYRNKADRSLANIEKRLAQYNSAISQAKQEAETIQNNSVSKATNEKDKIIAKAEKESKQLIERKLKNIQKEEDEAKSLLEKDVSFLARQIIDTILRQ